ncbi:MAG: hypothetical protein ACI4LN_03850 [Anaerovoracaceae bacterium]
MLNNSNQIDDTEKKGGWIPVTVRMPDAEAELINRNLIINKLKLYLRDCKKSCDHTETYYDKGAVKATKEIIKLVMAEPAACNLKENSAEEDCLDCRYYELTTDQYPCSHCRNCYTSKFKAKAGEQE